VVWPLSWGPRLMVASFGFEHPETAAIVKRWRLSTSAHGVPTWVWAGRKRPKDSPAGRESSDIMDGMSYSPETHKPCATNGCPNTADTRVALICAACWNEAIERATNGPLSRKVAT
jgi:hypothetical protein